MRILHFLINSLNLLLQSEVTDPEPFLQEGSRENFMDYLCFWLLVLHWF